MRRCLFLISLLLSSAACSSQADYAQRAGVSQDRAAATAVASAAVAPKAQPVAFADSAASNGGTREFSYKWPAAVSAEPSLVELLTAERSRILAAEKKEWAEAVEGLPPDCGPCRNRSFAKEWKVVANTPGYLSLSGAVSTYTGGAHGMQGLETLVWDRAAGKAMPGGGLFVSAAALDAALGPKLCGALNRERARRRGEPVRADAADPYGTGFNACQTVADATVLVGSSTGRAFDRIGLWFGPYVAGPYAEGVYELDFPVDAAVLRAVKPEFAAAFALGG